jgi:hypothetical protein
VTQLNTLHIGYGNESTNVTDPTEENVTNAIIKLTKATKKNVLFLTGHASPGSTTRRARPATPPPRAALENENYQVKDIPPRHAGESPRRHLAADRRRAEKPLDAHETEGDRGVLEKRRAPPRAPAAGAERRRPEGAPEKLGGRRRRRHRRRSADPPLPGPTLGVRADRGDLQQLAPITPRLQRAHDLPARALGRAGEERERRLHLARTHGARTSWAEKDIAGIFKAGRASLGPDDKKGPISVAAAATAQLKKLGVEKPGDAKVVAVGTAAFANNRYIKISSTAIFSSTPPTGSSARRN